MRIIGQNSSCPDIRLEMAESQHCCMLRAGSSLITGDPNADKAAPPETMAPVAPPVMAADPADQKSQGLEVSQTVLFNKPLAAYHKSGAAEG